MLQTLDNEKKKKHWTDSDMQYNIQAVSTSLTFGFILHGHMTRTIIYCLLLRDDAQTNNTGSLCSPVALNVFCKSLVVTADHTPTACFCKWNKLSL